MDTVWILGDQLNRSIASLEGRAAGDVRLLFIEADQLIGRRRYHRQRVHFVLSAMRHFAAALEADGWDVDYRTDSSFSAAVAAHRKEYNPDRLIAMEPMNWHGRQILEQLDVEVVRSNQFFCHYDDFAAWADGRKRLVMEDFYRMQRAATGYLMDGDEPVGDRWNFDDENREPPPRDGRDWPERPTAELDEIDRAVLNDLPDGLFGADPDGTWATTRGGALERLGYFVDEVLPIFGPHQDAMITGEWSMAHSLLSPYINVGLLSPREVCEAAVEAFEKGNAPLASVEGFIRQIIGWREYVWGIYWMHMPEYAEENALEADLPVPPAFLGESTHMACVASAMDGVVDHAYAHHIQRLMIFGNLALIAGIDPQEMTDWMRASFIDAADWVMVPNVLGMALYADGGRMATKPYAAGGNYISKMSNHCGDCRYDPKQRTGDDACPFTTLYWDFLARNRERLGSNHRIGRQLWALDRLTNLPEVRNRAEWVRDALVAGEL
jgi:deoxyribodipyrimidine photolyase-related protein